VLDPVRLKFLANRGQAAVGEVKITLPARVSHALRTSLWQNTSRKMLLWPLDQLWK